MTGLRWGEERHQVLLAAREMVAAGLIAGTSGNVSMRLPPADGVDLLAITPAGRHYSSMTAADILVVDFEVEPVEGDLVPSSESLLHVAVHRARPDVGAVVHTHSTFASVAAVAGLELPPIIDEMVVRVGGPVRVSRYAFPATEELAESVCEALDGRNAALIRNHGAVGVGRDLREALNVCALLERTAQVFIHASMLGKAHPLPADAVETELAIYQMRRQVSGEASQ